MYVVGVNAPTTVASAGAGVYLFGQDSGGWGREGLGAQNNKEPQGQNRGRWFVPVPFGVPATGEYPSAHSYNGRLFICGGYGYNLVLDEHHRLWRQGIRPPEQIPDITGAGAPSSTIAYFSWWDELTGERSPLSKGAVIGTAAPRTWNNLPTRPPDDEFQGDNLAQTDTPNGPGITEPFVVRFPYGGRIRQVRPGDRYSFAENEWSAIVHTSAQAAAVAPAAGLTQPVMLAEPWGELNALPIIVHIKSVTRPTHLELWLSLAGDLPRLAMRVAIGTTQVVESKGIADLGEAFFTQFQRFPRCTMNAIYHDRQIMAGDSENPDTVFLSALFQPERFEGLQFRTRDGKAITGLLATRDFCMVLTRSSAYLLQGYTDTDYTLVPVDQSIGAVGHACNVVIHGNPHVWSEKGPYLYNGGWHPLSPENRWRSPARAEKMIATEDPQFNTYIVSQAHKAAMSFLEPYQTWKESGVGEDWDPNDVIPRSLPDQTKYFAVLDYTVVTPATGGAMGPARLSWDSTDMYVVPAESPPDFAVADDQVFMKFLRNRYGRGNLYRIYGDRQVNFNFEPGYTVADWLNDFPSFVVGGMLLPEATIQLDLVPEENSEIVTPFDYLGDGGGYLMEQKQIKRLWYYMRMMDGTINLYVAPGPGFWGTRIYGVTHPAIVYPVTFVGGEYRGGLIEAPHADVIMPVLPDFLSGRGMWLHLKGKNLFFSGYAVEAIWGSEVVHPE